MVLLEVFEASTVIGLDGWHIRLIYQVFCDIGKVLWVEEDLLKVVVLTVYSIDLIYKSFSADTFDLGHYLA
jgi:hypothetical protein